MILKKILGLFFKLCFVNLNDLNILLILLSILNVDKTSSRSILAIYFIFFNFLERSSIYPLCMRSLFTIVLPYIGYRFTRYSIVYQDLLVSFLKQLLYALCISCMIVYYNTFKITMIFNNNFTPKLNNINPWIHMTFKKQLFSLIYKNISFSSQNSRVMFFFLTFIIIMIGHMEYPCNYLLLIFLDVLFYFICVLLLFFIFLYSCLMLTIKIKISYKP